MYHCPMSGCAWESVSCDRYVPHLRRMHDPFNGFKCIHNCGRQMTSLQSLQKHMKCCPKNKEMRNSTRSIEIINQTVSFSRNANKSAYNSNNSFCDPTNSRENDNLDSKMSESNSKNIITSKNLNNSVLKLTTEWLSDSTLPRKVAFKMSRDIKLNIIQPLNDLINLAHSTLLMSKECKELLISILQTYDCPTEYSFRKELKRRELFEDPIFFTINDGSFSENVLSNTSAGTDRIEGVLMPVKFMLKKYMQADGVMNQILASLKLSSNGIIRSLIGGSIWQERTACMCDKIVVPINIYFDDFCTGDTASCHSRSTSICAIYLSVPCLPGYLLARLSNILIVGFIRSQDRKRSSNDITLCTLVELLIELEQEGDNLGMNGILDYVESFRANFFCRVCKRMRVQTETDVIEYPTCFRNIPSYDRDVQLDIISKTGIKGPSILNRIPSYHVTHNFVFDIMHDLLEGVCVYDIQHILHYIIYEKCYISLSEFNARKNFYGDQNSGNLVHDIQERNVKIKNIKCTASEMKTLVTFLPLILGPLVPQTDEVWQITCALVKIVHICLLREITFDLINELRSLITFHHNLYIKLFRDCDCDAFRSKTQRNEAILSSEQ
ncbi:uncharacterized protein LOC129727501 isoform X2 [Wyeomyia smithii]|uniref:uncharacterized protein LOC129727501 isoform X2 n=1 Tax=Wyeomyia smithii TaxID=174621 RepID=UPI002467DBB1|nr:uncharacterized protein LOC129727501 isoform X2 [Wyeomyia smithii]